MTSMDRRRFIVGTTATAITLSTVKAQAADTTGITSTEIRIGSTSPQSGPVSAYGVQARCQAAYFKMINDRGGIAGRKINFIYYDDAFNPAKTVEQTRKLVENDEVAIPLQQPGYRHELGDRQIRECEEDPAPVLVGERRQMERLQDPPMEHGFRAQRPHRSCDLREAHARGEA